MEIYIYIYTMSFISWDVCNICNLNKNARCSMSTTWLAGFLNHQRLVTKNCTKGKTPPTSKLQNLACRGCFEQLLCKFLRHFMTSPILDGCENRNQDQIKWSFFLLGIRKLTSKCIFISSSFVGDISVRARQSLWITILHETSNFPQTFLKCFPSFLIWSSRVQIAFGRNLSLLGWSNITPMSCVLYISVVIWPLTHPSYL